MRGTTVVVIIIAIFYFYGIIYNLRTDSGDVKFVGIQTRSFGMSVIVDLVNNISYKTCRYVYVISIYKM
jgi:hypothetical protein